MGEENHDRSIRWWTVRGGQTGSTEHADYLKVYLQANGHSMVQRGGYVHGVVRPGWGCQYLLAIQDCPTRDECMVNVFQISSFVFAPRVEFAEPFNAVFVDGKRWDYHDGRHVFLPNRRGMYRIAVRDGMPPRPRITRTWAALSRAELREDDSGLALELDVGHPEGRLDPHTVGLSYYLQIETFGWILGDVSGVVRVVPREELGLTPAQYAQPDNSLVVGVPNGPVTLRFKSASDDQRTVQ